MSEERYYVIRNGCKGGLTVHEYTWEELRKDLRILDGEEPGCTYGYGVISKFLDKFPGDGRCYEDHISGGDNPVLIIRGSVVVPEAAKVVLDWAEPKRKR